MPNNATSPRQHAIVIGGSMAGLFAARVLSDHFERVTILERDAVNDSPESRKGQPQTRHLHGILEPTLSFVRDYLPGVQEELLAGGAVCGDVAEVARWYHFDGYKIQSPAGLWGMTVSRPFFEWHIRRAVTSLPNVRLLSETAAEELITDESRTRVLGVSASQRGTDTPTILDADLIVDASGRGSSTPKWLAKLGYPTPAEQEVKVRVGYATRTYHREPDSLKGAQSVLISPTPPHGKCGAFMIPIEGQRWIVTAAGWHGEHPPADEDGFLEFLRNLPAPDIYEIISRAKPLSEIVTHKFPASRRLHYQKLDRFPERLLVIGDGVASFNPVYGQGMTSAALQARVLNTTLTQPTLDGIWQPYFREISRVVDQPWQLAVGEDFRYPETEGQAPLGSALINQYVAGIHRAVQRDPVVYQAFLKVMNLIEPPTSLMQPHMIWRVISSTRKPKYTPHR